MGDLHHMPGLRLTREQATKRGMNPDYGRPLSEEVPAWQMGRNNRLALARVIEQALRDYYGAEDRLTSSYRCGYEDEGLRAHRDSLAGDGIDALLEAETALGRMHQSFQNQRRAMREGFDDVA